MSDLLKEEIMDGDNQYYCSNCNSKQNAKRLTKLGNLPPVLNLQLLRFVYDRNSGYKKKLSNRIKFGETLDLTEYTTNAEETSIYQLGAILMHVGKSAYSGHYMAQIKNFQTNEWFNFNDEVITKVKKKQQLGCTDEEVDPKEEKEKETESSSRANKTFSTANAYLLVYYRSDSLSKTPSEEEIQNSSNQSQLVLNDNDKLELWFNKFRNSKIDQNETKNTERAVVNTVYNSLWLNTESVPKPPSNKTKRHNSDINEKSPHTPKFDKSQLYFLSIDFLKRLLSFQNNLCPSDAASINSIQKYLCQHRKLNPLAVNKFKLVNKEGIDKIMNMFALSLNDLGALEAFNDDTTRCIICVSNCFEYLKCREKLKVDMKTIRTILKLEANNNGDQMVARNSDETSEQSDNSQPMNRGDEMKRENDDEDVILIDKDEDSKSTMSGDGNETNGKDFFKEFLRQQRLNGEDKLTRQYPAPSPIKEARILAENNKENNEFQTNLYFWVGKESIKVTYSF